MHSDYYPDFIKDAYDCVYLLKHLDNTQKTLLCESSNYYLPMLLTNTCYWNTFLPYMDSKQLTELVIDTNNLLFFNSAFDVEKVTNNFNPAQCSLLFNRYNEQFNEIVKYIDPYTMSDYVKLDYAVNESASIINQLRYHSYNLFDLSTHGTLKTKSPGYLRYNLKWFTPYQDIKDAENRLTRPLAMILMHCIACIMQVALMVLVGVVAPLTLLIKPVLGDPIDEPGSALKFMLSTTLSLGMQLAIINAELLVALPLVLASIFTRSVTTVFTLCSDYLNSTDSFKLDEEEIGDLAKRYAHI